MSARRFRSLHPVKSEKQEISWSNLIQNTSTAQHILLADATDTPSTAGQVHVGDTIRWIFIEVNIAPETVTNPKVVHWAVWKKLSGQTTNITPSVYDADNKKNIFKRGMEMLPKDVSTVFKRIFVVRIPRGYSRMGEGDEIYFTYICSSAESINNCGFAIFRNLS